MREDYWAQVELPDLNRRVANVLLYGTIDSVDFSDKNAPRVRVKAGNFLTGWIPWLSQNAGTVQDWNPPSLHTQVLIGSPSGDLNQACVIGSTHQSRFPAPSDDGELQGRIWSDGAKDTYHEGSKVRTIEVPSGGTIRLKCGNSMIEMTSSGIKITGDRLDLNEGD